MNTVVAKNDPPARPPSQPSISEDRPATSFLRLEIQPYPWLMTQPEVGISPRDLMEFFLDAFAIAGHTAHDSERSARTTAHFFVRSAEFKEWEDPSVGDS